MLNISLLCISYIHSDLQPCRAARIADAAGNKWKYIYFFLKDRCRTKALFDLTKHPVAVMFVLTFFYPRETVAVQPQATDLTTGRNAAAINSNNSRTEI